jgi:hypothetical protein
MMFAGQMPAPKPSRMSASLPCDGVRDADPAGGHHVRHVPQYVDIMRLELLGEADSSEGIDRKDPVKIHVGLQVAWCLP